MWFNVILVLLGFGLLFLHEYLQYRQIISAQPEYEGKILPKIGFLLSDAQLSNIQPDDWQHYAFQQDFVLLDTPLISSEDLMRLEEILKITQTQLIHPSTHPAILPHSLYLSDFKMTQWIDFLEHTTQLLNILMKEDREYIVFNQDITNPAKNYLLFLLSILRGKQQLKSLKFSQKTDLKGWVLHKDWQISWLVVNPSAESHTLLAGTFFPKKIHYQKLYGQPLANDEENILKNMLQKQGRSMGKIHIPPYSISYLSDTEILPVVWENNLIPKYELKTLIHTKDTRLTVSYKISQKQMVQLKFFDKFGQRKYSSSRMNLSSGIYEMIFDIEKLKKGIYLLELGVAQEKVYAWVGKC
jgi:hypothetical protein